MSEFQRYMDGVSRQDRSRLHTAILARIISYDPVLMQADLDPLIRDPEINYAPIVRASVSCLRAGGFVIRPPYRPGDIVVAVIIERGIDGVFATGKKAARIGGRNHSLTDAVVIGGFTAKPDPLSDDYGDELLIGTEDGENRITMDTDGNMTISVKGVLNIDAEKINLNTEEV